VPVWYCGVCRPLFLRSVSEIFQYLYHAPNPLADSKLIVETEGELAQNYRQCEQLVRFFEIDSSAVEILAGDFATDGHAVVATNMSHILLEGGTFLAQGESAQGITLSNSALSVNGGTLGVASEFPSAVTLSEGSAMTMTSGTVWSSADDVGNVISLESGHFEMTGGTLEGSGVVQNRIVSAIAGQLDIHGGTIQRLGGVGGGSRLHLMGIVTANCMRSGVSPTSQHERNLRSLFVCLLLVIVSGCDCRTR